MMIIHVSPFIDIFFAIILSTSDVVLACLQL